MVIYSSKKSAVTSLSELSLDVTDKCFQINITRSRFCFPIWLALYHSPLILINQTSVSTNSSVWPGSMLGCQAYNYVFIIPNATTRFIFFFLLCFSDILLLTVWGTLPVLYPAHLQNAHRDVKDSRIKCCIWWSVSWHNIMLIQSLFFSHILNFNFGLWYSNILILILWS